MVVQRHGRPGARGSGALAVTVALVGSLVGTTAVTGCAAPEDPGPPADPALAVRNAPDALTKAGTSKASTSMEMASGGTRVTIRGEGGYDFRRRTGRLQVVLPKDPAGTSEHRPITELLTPGALYMKNRGAGVPADKWVRVDTTGLDATGGLLDDTSDWWQQEDPAEGLPGFVGGVERPDLFEEPVPDEDEHEDGEGDEEDDAEAPSRGRRLARVLLRRKPRAAAEAYGTEEEPDAAPVSRLRLANPFVLLAALLLLGGALFGSPVVLALGWLLAYGSRRLTPGEVKAAVLVIPGLAAASGVVWLWGRVEGRWGDPVGAGGEAMGAAVSETWPWALRGAAVASALFLIWRSRR